ncbi:hypothetical protein DV738_g621, partial [Chaetothyriales sp. CBS 135597]
MAPQHAEVLETIAALRWKLRRDRQPPTDDTIAAATNRGNKLKKGATSVHAGALPYPHGPTGYKEASTGMIHAGYTRYILARNPKRHNEYGYELDDSESDAEAEADAADENAYSGVRIEELLRPLTHPSELATHPTLSTPYLDSALPDMVKSLEDKLRQERANLWRAKMLHRQLIGDENWVPCGAVETPDDWDLFEPRYPSSAEQSKKRKLREPHDRRPTQKEPQPAANDDPADGANTTLQNGDNSGNIDNSNGTNDDEPTTNGVHTNGDNPLDAPVAAEENMAEDGDKPDDGSRSASPAPRPRRITRALAAENTTAPTPPLSPTPSDTTIDSALLTADPLFLIPSQFSTLRRLPAILQDLQLPVEEMLDTRRLLFMYIQKQEESVRGFEAVLGKLIKAMRMKDQLWEMCKAEGHIGEWSDGEDWIDATAWGERQEDLKKGKDEDDVTQEEEGRKGKRRRVRDRERE